MLPAPREQWESGREIIKCWGEAYLAAGDAEAAINSFESARLYAGADQDASLFALLAEAYLQKGRKTVARRMLAAAARIGGKRGVRAAVHPRGRRR